MAELTSPYAGCPGASAQAIYDARSRAEQVRQLREVAADAAWRAEVTRIHPVLGRLVRLARPRPAFGDEPQPVRAWAVGAAAERETGAVLNRCRRVVALHDRSIIGSRANIDHVAVGRSGVFVIDTKAYRTTVEVARVGGLLLSRNCLLVSGSERADLIETLEWQVGIVRRIVERHHTGPRPVPVAGALCFVGASGLPPVPVRVDDAWIVDRGSLPPLVRRRGPLCKHEVADLAGVLSRALPPR